MLRMAANAKRWLCAGGAALLFALGAAAAAVPEPAGFWTGPIGGPVPASLSGGRVIHTMKLATFLKSTAVLVVDVSDAPRRPAGLAPRSPWLPLPHQVITGGIWVPGAGAGIIDAPVETLFSAQLAQGTAHEMAHPIVIYCHKNCWLSWNAAKRAIGYGYRRVFWYPDGMEGWRAAGFATQTAAPAAP